RSTAPATSPPATPALACTAPLALNQSASRLILAAAAPSFAESVGPVGMRAARPRPRPPLRSALIDSPSHPPRPVHEPHRGNSSIHASPGHTSAPSDRSQALRTL